MGETFVGFASHSMMNDATDAKIWHHCKTYLGEFAWMYYMKPFSFGDTDHETFYLKMLGDMQIQSEGTDKAARRMTLSQCRSIGFPKWLSIIDKLGVAPLPAGDARDAIDLEGRFREQLRLQKATRLEEINIHSYCHSTDGGSDQRS